MIEVTDAGVVIKTYEELVESLAVKIENQIGVGSRVRDPESVFGAILRPFCAELYDAFEMVRVLSNSHSLNAGEFAISDVGEINGLTRLEEIRSSVMLRVAAKPLSGCTIPAGSLVSTSQNSSILWETLSTVVVAAGSTATVTAECRASGAIQADTGTLTYIKTPVYGWASVTNPNDATPGRAREPIAVFRARQDTVAKKQGACSAPMVYRALTQVPGVVGVSITQNLSDVTDANGTLPGHLRATVQGGENLAVATAILENVAIPCTTQGAVGATVPYTDIPGGVDLTVYFDRPASVSVAVKIVYHTLPGFATDGSVRMVEAVLAYVGDKRLGEPLYANELYGPLYAIPNMVLTSIEVARSGSPTWSTVVQVGPTEQIVTQESYIEWGIL